MQNILLSGNSSSVPPFPPLGFGDDSPLNTSSPFVLVVDDESLIADTIVQILIRSGFRAQAVYNGHDAIEAARRLKPAILLSDVLMPALDGVEAAIAIREISPETRIVLISGQAATVEILSRARARGHDFELLPKPIHPVELLKHLREVR